MRCASNSSQACGFIDQHFQALLVWLVQCICLTSTLYISGRREPESEKFKKPKNPRFADHLGSICGELHHAFWSRKELGLGGIPRPVLRAALCDPGSPERAQLQATSSHPHGGRVARRLQSCVLWGTPPTRASARTVTQRREAPSRLTSCRREEGHLASRRLGSLHPWRCGPGIAARAPDRPAWELPRRRSQRAPGAPAG